MGPMMTMEYFKEAGWELLKDLPFTLQVSITADFGRFVEMLEYGTNGGVPPPVESPVSPWAFRILLQHFYRQTPLTMPAAAIEAYFREDPITPPVECLTCGYPQPAEFAQCILCQRATGPNGSYGKKLAARALFN